MLLSKSDKFELFEAVSDELVLHMDRRIDSYRLKKLNENNTNINTHEMRYSSYKYIKLLLIIIIVVLKTKNH